MDIRPALLVRAVDPSESLDEVVDEAKALTWTHRCGVALLRIDAGQLLLVRGGADGIQFDVVDEKVFVTIEGVPRQVTLLAWHTHPRPTGPSDHDCRFLQMLRQPESFIYEMFASRNGTRFYAEDREVTP